MKHQATIQPRMETYRTLLKQNTFLSGAAEECLKQLCAPEDQIYVTLWAPALVQYVAWVLEEAQKTDRKDCISWQEMHIRCILLQRNGGIFTYSHRNLLSASIPLCFAYSGISSSRGCVSGPHISFGD